MSVGPRRMDIKEIENGFVVTDWESSKEFFSSNIEGVIAFVKEYFQTKKKE